MVELVDATGASSGEDGGGIARGVTIMMRLDVCIYDGDKDNKSSGEQKTVGKQQSDILLPAEFAICHPSRVV